jgi:hypothetical protein
MEESMLIPHGKLLAPRREYPMFNPVLAACIKARTGLHVSASDQGMVIKAENSKRSDDNIELQGRWLSPALSPPPGHSFARLLMPFIFLIEGMYLPHRHLVTLSRDDRTTADFLMRNLFHSLVRREKIRYVSIVEPVQTKEKQMGQELMRTYLWLAKSVFKDTVLSKPNALELLLANAHLPVISHEHVLLETGAQDLRAIATNYAKCGVAPDQLARMRTLRSRFIVHYKG